MCGKFTQMYSWRTLVGLMRGLSPKEADRDAGGSSEGGGGGPEEDRAEVLMPMRFANIIALDEKGERQLVPMRWGFLTPWRTGGIMHARCETIDTLRTFKDAFANRRGILVCKTFNEGKEVPSSKPGGKSKTEQFVITPRDGKPISIAVIYEQCPPDHGAFWTFAMVTTEPNKLIGTITDRMPAILQPGDWAKWLGEEPATVEELKGMLKPYEGDWDMGPEKPPAAPKPPKPPKPPRSPRVTDKPRQGGLFDP